LNSRAYLFLDVFPMVSLSETHLNYLSTLRGALQKDMPLPCLEVDIL
jgi:hypothetical protein